MPRRHILTDRQRSALFDLPTDEVDLLRHYTLADDDLEHIRARRRPSNRLGFAVQLCAFRYPGRLLTSGEVIPLPVAKFIAAQIGLRPDDLAGYAETEVTRRRHLVALRKLYGYRIFSGRRARDLRAWLDLETEAAQSNDDLAWRFVEECRRTQTILPGVSRIERLCADALVAAERRIEARIADRLDEGIRARLDAILTETVDGKVSRFIWLRRFETGRNSADMNRLLERLEYLQQLGLDAGCLTGLPPHRITRLRRQGERYFTDGLQDISGDRRLAILAVCAVEWRSAIADTIVETHDRIVGKTWRDAKRLCDARIMDAKASVQDTLRAFFALGAALLEARSDDAPLDEAVAASCSWDGGAGDREAGRAVRSRRVDRGPQGAPRERARPAGKGCAHRCDPRRGDRRRSPQDRAADRHPAEANELVLDLYRRLPDVRITDLMLEVDAATGFTDAFTHLRTGAPCKDRIGLLNVLLAEGINLGLSKMAEASNTHDYFQSPACRAGMSRARRSTARWPW